MVKNWPIASEELRSANKHVSDLISESFSSSQVLDLDHKPDQQLDCSFVRQFRLEMLT